MDKNTIRVRARRSPWEYFADKRTWEYHTSMSVTRMSGDKSGDSLVIALNAYECIPNGIKC